MTAASPDTLAERSDPRGRKRANGEGSSYQRADGRWVAQIAWPHGRREYRYGPTRALVACKLREALQSHDRGLAAPHRTGTLADFLRAWVRSLEGTVRPTPVAQYRGDLRCHVIPRLGRVPLARLTPQHLQELYSELRTAGLSPMSIRYVHAELHRALEQAVRWDAVPCNVASLVDPPQAPRRPLQTLAPEQVRRLLAAAEGDRFEALYVLAVTTGMRRGELLGLRWVDVDLQGQALAVTASLQREVVEGLVRVEPKTSRSRRRVLLTQAPVACLDRHRAAQHSERAREGVGGGSTGSPSAVRRGHP